jgi:hypothetical protein
VQPVEEVASLDAIEPVAPIEDAAPVEPIDDVEQIATVQPVEEVASLDAIEPVAPIEDAAPVEPIDDVEPVDPAAYVEPVNGTEAVDSTDDSLSALEPANHLERLEPQTMPTDRRDHADPPAPAGTMPPAQSEVAVEPLESSEPTDRMNVGDDRDAAATADSVTGAERRELDLGEPADPTEPGGLIDRVRPRMPTQPDQHDPTDVIAPPTPAGCAPAIEPIAPSGAADRAHRVSPSSTDPPSIDSVDVWRRSLNAAANAQAKAEEAQEHALAALSASQRDPHNSTLADSAADAVAVARTLAEHAEHLAAAAHARPEDVQAYLDSNVTPETWADIDLGDSEAPRRGSANAALAAVNAFNWKAARAAPVQRHSTARAVRDVLDISGDEIQSTHILSGYMFKDRVEGYSYTKSPTILLPARLNNAIDFGTVNCETGVRSGGWVHQFKRRLAEQAEGGKPVTWAEAFRLQFDAIQDVSDNLLEPIKGALQHLLFSEMFGRLELDPNAAVPP